MASVDDAETNKRFAAEHGGGFSILSDPSKQTAMAYGVIRTDRPPDQQYAARFTFYIGPDGKILDIDKTVKPASSGTDMVAKLAELKVAKRAK